MQFKIRLSAQAYKQALSAEAKEEASRILERLMHRREKLAKEPAPALQMSEGHPKEFHYDADGSPDNVPF
jgi:hypothetical protein